MKRFVLLTLYILCTTMAIHAQKQKVQHRPYIDQRRLHYGFYIGMHAQDLEFENNGYVTPEGETWFAEVADYSPGFSVGVLAEAYITPHIAIRAIPSLYFGQKKIIFHEQQTHQEHSQLMKSTLLGCPINLKMSGPRCNNHRPYVVAGINPTLNLTSKDRQALLMKNVDCYVEIGIGCDMYLPYFKLIPELKFCFGIKDILEKERPDLIDKTLMKFTESVNSASSRMIMLTFYFE